MDNKEIIIVNELKEKAYNHLGINDHKYLVNFLDNKNIKKTNKKDTKKEKIKKETKKIKEKEYNYDEVFFTKELNEIIENIKNKKEKINEELNIKNILIQNKEFKYYDLNENVLVKNIDINDKNKNTYYILDIKAEDKKNRNRRKEQKIEKYRNINLNIKADNSKIVCIYIINGGNAFSIDNITLESKNNSEIIFKYLIIGETFGNLKHISRAFKNSKIDVSGVYFLSKDNSLDLMYEGIMEEERSKTYFNFEGICKDNSKKISKDILNFKNGAKESVGIEKENITILSEEAKVKTAPILLSSEEDIIGEHGYSSGMLDKNKIYYMMSRGVSFNDAKYLIIKSKIDRIIKNNLDLDKNEKDYLSLKIQKIEEKIWKNLM